MVLFYREVPRVLGGITSRTAHSNQGFVINISETKCALITLETSCKKSGISETECTAEFHSSHKHLSEALHTDPHHPLQKAGQSCTVAI